MNKYLQQLIDDQQKELMNCRVNIEWNEKEIRNPAKRGVLQATEQVNEWKKHMLNVEATLEMYLNYAKEQYEQDLGISGHRGKTK